MVWRLFQFTLAIAIGLLIFAIYTLNSAQTALSRIPNVYSFGPADADLRVVAFLDYSCTHCRDSYPAIIEAVEKDGHVQFSPLLVSGPQGSDEFAMRLTYGAAVQGKYHELFQEIMGNYRPISDKDITDLALKYDMDSERLAKSVNDPIVDKMIHKSENVFKKLSGRYTPTFFIGPRIKYVPTQTPTAQDFLRIFQEARSKHPAKKSAKEDKK